MTITVDPPHAEPHAELGGWVEHIDSPYLARYPGPRIDMTNAPIHRGAPGKASWLDRGYRRGRHARHPMDRVLRRSQNHTVVGPHEIAWSEEE